MANKTFDNSVTKSLQLQHRSKITSKFIQAIKERPAIWHKKGFDSHVKYKKWVEVADMFSMRVDDAKSKWKNLKDTLRVELKRYRNGDSPWYHFQEMMFAKASMKIIDGKRIETYEKTDKSAESTSDPLEINSTMISSNLESDDAHSNSLDIEVYNEDPENFTIKVEPNESPTSQSVTNQCTDTEDDDLLFFKSLLPYMKKLSDDKRLLFRTNVQQTLYNILYDNFSESKC